jgi:phosphate-selective porin OprO/OprP
MIKRLFFTSALILALLASGSSIKAQQADTLLRVNQYGKKVTRMAVNPEARNSILNFESEDQSYRFWFDNRVYFDGALFPNTTLNPAGNGVDIRRARFAAKAVIDNYWYGEIDLDFAGSVVELKDVYVKYERSFFNVKAGHFKESFSMETTTTSRYLTFIERSLVSKMAPSRHLGVQGNFYGQKWLYSLGFHGRTIGEAEEVTFAQDANKDFGVDDGLSITSRFVFNPLLQDNKVLHVGVAGSYRTPKTSDEITNSYRFSTRSLTSINRKKYIDTDDILNVDHNVLLGAELAGYYNNFMLHAEYMQNTITQNITENEIKLQGAFVQAGVLLMGGKYNYNKGEGEFTQVSCGKEWGELELAFRFDYLNANDLEAEVYGGAANAYTAGLTYHINNNVKLMLNYQYLNHDRFANGKGKLYIYQDENGVKYTDPLSVEIPTGKGGDDFGFISARVEIDF